MPLEDEAGGWVCTQLELGWPEVRDVVSNRPDQHGTDDLSQYWASRQVSADITCYGIEVDGLAAQFAPYMVPSVRPVLHYILDRAGAPERTLTLRAANYAWPITGKQRRNVQLQWVAPDPVARDVVVKSEGAWSGSTSPPGRAYDLRFNRIYAPGSGAPVNARLENHGDVAVAPLIRIYGPITGPQVHVWAMYADHQDYFTLIFRPTLTIDAGHWVDVDNERHTCWLDGDDTQPVTDQLDWMASRWVVLAPMPVWHSMALMGSTTSGITQAQAIWRDGFLT